MTYGVKSIIAAACIFVANTGYAEQLSLNAISKYLNSIKTASGEFTQVNDDGSISTGQIAIKRPGRIRFEYSDAVVFANNGAVVIVDKKSNTNPETYPLKRTPLSIILAKNVDLSRANMVVGQSYDGIATTIKAQDPKNPQHGNIELKFTPNPTQLRQWVINNADGSKSTVILGELDRKVRLPNRLFQMKERN